MMSLPPSSSTPPTQDEFPSPLSPNRLHLPPPLPPSRFLGERRYVREICVVFLFGTTVTTADSDDKDDILTCSLPLLPPQSYCFLIAAPTTFYVQQPTVISPYYFFADFIRGEKGRGEPAASAFPEQYDTFLRN